jgi:hypothetical protein
LRADIGVAMHESAQESQVPGRRGWLNLSLRYGWAVPVCALAAAIGCTRQHYREAADKDVAGVITQKNIFPDWKVKNWHVYPDSRARFADPACPDHPPFPPDDYAAWLISPNPQKPHRKWGVGRYEGTGYLKSLEEWDDANRTEDASDETEKELAPYLPGATPPKGAGPGLPPPPGSPAAKGNQPLPAAVDATAALAGSAAAAYLSVLRSDAKPFRLRIEQAMELGIFNAREFQDRREDLFLAALPVTLERFQFAAQAFAAETAVRSETGSQLPNAGNRWSLQTDASASKLFPTGATLLAKFANQVVFDLGTGRPDVAVSNLSLTVAQPLLRGGGFAVTLEPLTTSERNLLYAIRSFARWREVFFVALLGQGNYTNNPYGLQGLSTNLGRGIGANLTAPQAGFLPVLLQASNLNNQRKNITSLEQFLKLFQNLKEGGGLTDLQVIQVEQQLLGSRTSFLTATRVYLDALDNFKLQCGLPATLNLELDDTPIRPMRWQLQRFEQVYAQLAEFQDAAEAFNTAETPAQLRGRWLRLLTTSPLVRDTPLSKDYPGQIAALARMTYEEINRRIATLSDRRQKLLDQRAQRQLAGKDDSPTDLRELEGVEADIDLARFELALRLYETRPWLRAPKERQVGEQANAFRLATDAGLLVAIRARNQRLDRIRDAWPALPPLCLQGVDLLRVPLDEAYTKVGQVALSNRFDLMSARAQVVDSYRQIAVTANALQGVFNVQYDLNSATPAGGNQPFTFAGSRTSHALTLHTELPLVRRAERNQYRAALIAYQRQRRNLMAVEDNILVDTRSDLRQLRVWAEAYKLQRRSVELAYAQVDSARSTLLAPPDPASPRGAAGDVAALTQQLLNAQAQLLSSQNGLYTAWMTYLAIRMELALDLELLPLDARGVWNDDALRCPTPASPGPAGPAERPGPPVTPERLPEPRPAIPARPGA